MAPALIFAEKDTVTLARSQRCFLTISQSSPQPSIQAFRLLQDLKQPRVSDLSHSFTATARAAGDAISHT